MTDMTAPSHSGWKVTGQREEKRLAPGGMSFVDGAVITFETADGNSGSVFVPNNQLQPGTVGAIIDMRAGELDALTGLYSPPTR